MFRPFPILGILIGVGLAVWLHSPAGIVLDPARWACTASSPRYSVTHSKIRVRHVCSQWSMVQ